MKKTKILFSILLLWLSLFTLPAMAVSLTSDISNCASILVVSSK